MLFPSVPVKILPLWISEFLQGCLGCLFFNWQEFAIQLLRCLVFAFFFFFNWKFYWNVLSMYLSLGSSLDCVVPAALLSWRLKARSPSCCFQILTVTY